MCISAGNAMSNEYDIIVKEVNEEVKLINED